MKPDRQDDYAMLRSLFSDYRQGRLTRDVVVRHMAAWQVYHGIQVAKTSELTAGRKAIHPLSPPS